MELNKTKKWFYLLTSLWVVLILGLGSWWLYLVFKLHSTLSNLNIPELVNQKKFINMMKWEGSFFFIVLFFLGASVFLMYFRDMKKSKGMQAFFSSLSHELKTPLASMRLQAEVIKDLIEDESHSHEQLSQLTQRLVEDTYNLESELEKSLQLSRIEQDAPLTLSPIGLERFLRHHQQKSSIRIELDLNQDAKEILGDELALKMILRNLLENTKRHNPQSEKILIKSRRTSNSIELIYDDFGLPFKGDHKRLGELFYKFNSQKGSGIGLYLIKSLMKKMHGDLLIESKERLKFVLHFQPTGAQDE